MEIILDQTYWDTRWKNNETGWDIGYASPPISHYMNQYPDKEAAILIPGCGNAYEAAWLVANGFTNITLLDIAPRAVDQLKEKFANTPQIKLVCDDFFHHAGTYDTLIEQTFFCALPPARRSDYAQQAAALLQPNGRIVGVLFDTTFQKEGPPFGGSPATYRPIFTPYFHIRKMAPCYNSIPQRQGSEVFINLEKK